MPFCSNCGTQITATSKFCSECGASTIANTNARKTVYDGEIHKCPNCGELLESFMSNCPSCGYEIRSSNTANAVNNFVQSISNSRTEYEKIGIIRNFPIPNTKEDIFEILFLVSANIYEHPNKNLLKAWTAKFEQCYDKAKISFNNEEDFAKIQELYKKTKGEIKKLHIRKAMKMVIPVIAFLIINIIFWSFVFNASSDSQKKEIERLEAIVLDVEEALAAKDYDLAMMHAKSIDYEPDFESSSDYERQWDIKRDSLIKKVISEAAKDGITLTYPTDTADEKDDKTTHDYVEEFNSQMEDIKDMWGGFWNENESNDEESDQTSVNFDTAPPTLKDGESDPLTIKKYVFNIPVYYEEEGSKNEYLQFYAEKGESVVMLSISYPKESDDNYDVSFEGLAADNENMINSVSAMFNDGDVYSYEVLESSYGVKGILYRFTYNQKINIFKKVDGTGYCFCFPSEDDRRWFYVVLLQTNNVEGDDYEDDYFEMLDSIKKN